MIGTQSGVGQSMCTINHVCHHPLGPETSAEVEADLKALIDNPDSIPLPTYFIGAWGTGADAVLRMLGEHAKDVDGAHRLHYLGRCVLRFLVVEVLL